MCVILYRHWKSTRNIETGAAEHREARFFVKRQVNESMILQYDCAVRATQNSAT